MSQQLTIYDQLEAGVRSLDLRFYYDPTTGNYFTHHTFQGPELCSATGTQCDPTSMLGQILQFMQEGHPHEVILISFGSLVIGDGATTGPSGPRIAREPCRDQGALAHRQHDYHDYHHRQQWRDDRHQRDRNHGQGGLDERVGRAAESGRHYAWWVGAGGRNGSGYSRKFGSGEHHDDQRNLRRRNVQFIWTNHASLRKRDLDTMTNPMKQSFLITAALVCMAIGAQATNLFTIVLDHPNQTVAPGATVQFFGTIYSNTSRSIYINGDDLNLPSNRSISR
jgi:hypothetical protein